MPGTRHLLLLIRHVDGFVSGLCEGPRVYHQCAVVPEPASLEFEFFVRDVAVQRELLAPGRDDLTLDAPDLGHE